MDGWVEAVASRLSGAGLSEGRVLDAGCGTGRHSAALGELGYSVDLLDASRQLLDIARKRCPTSATFLADICTMTLPLAFNAVTCRGVLNDLLVDGARDAALGRFAGALVDGGLLVLDVREATQSKIRADGRPRRKEVTFAGGHLVFVSVPRWRDGVIVVDEHYEVTSSEGRSCTHDYRFRMRPWTVDELHERLTRAGFSDIQIELGVGRLTSDRLFVVARRSGHG